jgi:hypothetical protein
MHGLGSKGLPGKTRWLVAAPQRDYPGPVASEALHYGYILASIWPQPERLTVRDIWSIRREPKRFLQLYLARLETLA